MGDAEIVLEIKYRRFGRGKPKAPRERSEPQLHYSRGQRKEETMMQGNRTTYEYDSRLESGKWRVVTKRRWQELSFDNALRLPMAWAWLEAMPLAFASGIVAGVILDNPGVGVAIGTVVGGVVFVSGIRNGREICVEHMVSEDIYEAESAKLAHETTSEEVTRVDVYTYPDADTAHNAERGDDVPAAPMNSYFLPVGPKNVLAIYNAVNSGARRWSKGDLSSIPGISRNSASKLYDAMLEAGFLRWRENKPAHPDGAELTASGRAFWRRLRMENPYN